MLFSKMDFDGAARNAAAAVAAEFRQRWQKLENFREQGTDTLIERTLVYSLEEKGGDGKQGKIRGKFGKERRAEH